MAVFVIDGVVSLRKTIECELGMGRCHEQDIINCHGLLRPHGLEYHDRLLCEYPDGFWDDVSEEDTLLQQATDSHSDMGSGCPGNDMLI